MLLGISLWGKWIKIYRLKKKSFWEVKATTQARSWMWRKLLKLREVAKNFCKKEVGNGRHISFWFDNWSNKWVLFDILGERGIIDMGFRKEATLEEAVMNNRKRRKHRSVVLNEIEAELIAVKEKISHNVMDVNLWKRKLGFKAEFSSHETWLLLRESYAQCPWERGVWFSMATPKFAFITWLAMLDRLSTMDRISSWSQGVDTTCALCKNATETRNHLFLSVVGALNAWYSAKQSH
ncbi:uncharacterized protein LOC106398626 [Brassica napus]|uniref:uncharacterized protein LOC106297173 n=1 Tax=Brassica oleracea var. oleracea TaxID=109376 RepID=UPI0006A7501E|nr:PREDICTED: uncharacterized protein LOC106297173 [Brassica oleracea var. oleracea]XP_013694604.1 uncharacterized protein LOC106398626 [Brassica napus]